MVDLLIENGHILTMAGRGVGLIEHWSVAVEAGRIVKVGKSHEFFEADSKLAKDVKAGLL